ncbi:carbohydrate ABC transporter permease [Cellulomonas fimi]|uniref:Binding-protein-dependent transport systems inner membrane component n=1 Tax=Cellulomonas fimi (strain ATCC 484 / DSM 20113 / JCM 1341 / CCUG 24087 / LMG 16345 / NBRC 15513 / NCIMB 8980 / NCTC 7547 / NRS-133) TaxID=590998 RepID=F4H0J6_CELFA|nr:binding-protein-dependent transport systems inner membrane component [Cellulomonas fimi ATCC 484]VEH36033.1 sn-glycerol-3-phosphate transport system permease protein ugpA [Cellulomonas fimi]
MSSAAVDVGRDRTRSRDASSPTTRTQRSRDTRIGWLFVAPFVVVFAMFLLWPLLHGLWLSFTGESITGAGGAFLGFDNYAEALRDPIMWRSMLNTLWFTILSTVPLVLVALVMALLVFQGLPGQWLWRLSFFMPFLLASTVAAQFWIWMYNPQLGLVNYMLGALGVEGQAWLQDTRWAMLAVVVQTLWWTVGFNFLLYLTALQNIPEQQYEASALDGAGRWRQLWSITIPQLGPTTALIVILQILASLKVFDQIYIMTQGGPGGVTRPVVQYIFEAGFTGYRFGYASSIAYIFFAVIIIVSLAQVPFTFRRSAR